MDATERDDDAVLQLALAHFDLVLDAASSMAQQCMAVSAVVETEILSSAAAELMGSFQVLEEQLVPVIAYLLTAEPRIGLRREKEGERPEETVHFPALLRTAASAIELKYSNILQDCPMERAASSVFATYAKASPSHACSLTSGIASTRSNSSSVSGCTRLTSMPCLHPSCGQISRRHAIQAANRKSRARASMRAFSTQKTGYSCFYGNWPRICASW